MIAHGLSREGLAVVAIDKRDPGHGSTSASTALVLYEVDVPLIDLIRLRGVKTAISSYRCCLDAIDELEQTIHHLDARCDFRRRRSLYLAGDEQDVARLQKEFNARQQAGFDVDYLDQRAIEDRFSFSAPAAIYSHDAAEVDPFHLTTALLQKSLRNGARIFAHTEARRIHASHRRFHVRTDAGYNINTRWVVMAAGFETAGRAIKRMVRLKSSYAMTTKPLMNFKGWPDQCLIWETKRPYLYMRTTADNRIMAGGEDEDFTDARRRDQLIRKKRFILCRKLQRMFPTLKIEPAHAWAGTFGETKDSLPYIGSLRAGSKIIYALCYGANGTNFAVIAAAIIRDTILGRTNTNAKLFAFAR